MNIHCIEISNKIWSKFFKTTRYAFHSHDQKFCFIKISDRLIVSLKE